MKVLIVGGGGREHAIAQSVAKSEKVDKIYCTPGNAGIAALAECAPIGAMEFDKIVAFAKEKEVDLVIVGMDDPLVGGLVDELEAAGIRAFGPKKNAAILEGSKAFSKDLMKKYNIPTAAYENFTNPDAAIKYLETEAKFSPSPFYTKEVEDFCNQYVYQATVDAMKAEGRPFKGIIFFGLMLTPDGPKVLEYNARFGDPEAQVVLPRMKNDIIEVMEACIDGTLDQIDLQFEDNAAVCVVLASDGYPVKYDKGLPITGLEEFDKHNGYYCFHAGTKFDGDQIVTNGGRVLGVTAKGKDLKEARANAYAATEWVKFDNKYMRHDIGKAIDEA